MTAPQFTAFFRAAMLRRRAIALAASLVGIRPAIGSTDARLRLPREASGRAPLPARGPARLRRIRPSARVPGSGVRQPACVDRGAVQRSPRLLPAAAHSVDECDDTTAARDDACARNPPFVYACSTDSTEALVCREGRFALWRACRGPDGCKVDGRDVHCDTSLGDPGDPCAQQGSYACSTNGKAMLRCDGAALRWPRPAAGLRAVACITTRARWIATTRWSSRATLVSSSSESRAPSTANRSCRARRERTSGGGTVAEKTAR